MTAINLLLNTITPVLLIIFVGFIIGKWQKGINIQPIVDWIVFITTPCLLLASLSRSKISLIDASRIILLAVLIIGIMIGLTLLILRLTKSKRVGLLIPMVMGNTGFLGYPVALFAFGQEGLSIAILYDMISTLFLFTVGIYILHKQNDIREVFRLPIIYAIILGLLLSFFKIPIPDIIYKPVEMIGNITIPLALIILGYRLTRIKVSGIKIAALASLYKIFVGFALGLIFVIVFNITGVMKNIILLEAAMPAAVMAMILNQKYNRDPEIASSIVFITTIMSIITIPLILLFSTL